MAIADKMTDANRKVKREQARLLRGSKSREAARPFPGANG